MNNTINDSRKKTLKSHLEGIERRTEKRLRLSLPMRIFGCDVKTNNISPKGVYFEVTPKDAESYSPGKEVIVCIEGYSKSVQTGKSVWITVSGIIVRVDKKGLIKHKKLGVALKFSKEPSVFL
jgi:hypothetical protein